MIADKRRNVGWGPETLLFHQPRKRKRGASGSSFDSAAPSHLRPEPRQHESRPRARSTAPSLLTILLNRMVNMPADCPMKSGTGTDRPSAPSQSMQSTTSRARPSVGPRMDSYLLDRSEAARYLGVSRKTMLRFASERRVPVHRLCRKLLFKKSDLERFADEHAIPRRERRRYERT